ncbi:MAG: GGDEF domain-containing protein [Lachnospiraceae bacterium]|nr:GGDEF domain-containing protein [Lachnospiraceae bacterium]
MKKENIPKERLNNKIQKKIRYGWEERNKFFEAGAEEIAAENLRMLVDVSMASTLVILFFIMITPFIVTDWEPSIWHLMAAPAALAFYLVSFWYRSRGGNSIGVIRLMCLSFIACLMTIVIGIDAMQYGNQPSAFMQAMLIALPSLFTFRLYVIYTEMGVFEIAYIFFTFSYKGETMARNNCFSSIVGFVFSFFVAGLIQRLRAEAYNMKNQYKQLSMIDSLTGILNKANGEFLIRSYLEERKAGESCALLIMDVDNFKKINDTRGHQIGDLVLEAVGEVILRTFRSTDIMGRFGGDEFIIMMKNVPSEEVVRKKCQKLLDEVHDLSRRFQCELTCSIGVACLEQNDIDYETLFAITDDILYEAKTTGKARVVLRQVMEINSRKREEKHGENV